MTDSTTSIVGPESRQLPLSGPRRGFWDRFILVPGDLPPHEARRWRERAEQRRAQDDFVVALGDWLGRGPFEVFFTGTFKDEAVSLAVGKRAFNRFTHDLSRQLYGCRYHKRVGEGVFGFAAWERQKRGTPHVHALIGGLRNMRFADMHAAWRDALASRRPQREGFAWIKPFQVVTGSYCAKESGKDEWDIFGSWPGTDPRQEMFDAIRRSAEVVKASGGNGFER